MKYLPDNSLAFLNSVSLKTILWIGLILQSALPSVLEGQTLASPQQLVLRANQVKKAGDASAAIKLYTQAIESSQNQPTITTIAIKEVVHLLFKQEHPDVALIEKYIDRLMEMNCDDEETYDSAIHLVCYQTLNAKDEARETIWKTGLKRVADKKINFSDETFNDLTKLIDLSSHSSFSAEAAIDDLLRLNCESYTRQRLVEFKNGIRFQHTFRKTKVSNSSPEMVSMPLQRLMLAANLSKVRGQTLEAILIYQRVIKEYPNQREVVLLARKSLVQLQLKSNPVDFDAIQANLKYLKLPDGTMSNEIWNYACSAAFKKVALAAPKDRLSVWKTASKELNNPDVVFTNETFKELDCLVNLCKKDGSLSSLEVYTDLFLLVPDIETMRKLQWRRIAAFVEQKAWNQAIDAAKLDILLASTATEGPRASVMSCLEIMKSAKIPEKERLWFKKEVEQGRAISEEKANNIIDDLLKNKANERLQNKDSFRSPRQQIYLDLLAGNEDRATEKSYALIVEAINDTKDIYPAFNDLSIILAVSDRNYQSGFKFIRRLAYEGMAGGNNTTTQPTDSYTKIYKSISQKSAQINNPEVKQAAGKVLAGWEQRFLDCGQQAMREGDKEWACMFWIMAINTKDDPEQVVSLIDMICEKGKDVKSVQDNLEILQMMYPYIEQQLGKRRVMYKIAAMNYESGQFAQCLEILNQADRIDVQANCSRDISTGFMRALSLIQLRKYSEAVSLLGKLDDWPGTDDEHARALFLIGWVHLQKNDKTQALTALRRVTDWYPKTPFAPKAQELINRLEGI